jgi:NarL family two-component system response regulator LiaR
MADKIEVLIVDDHPVVRQGLRTLLELEEDIEVVGEAEDGLQAIDKVEELVPDVVLIDLVMPRLDGVTATRKIRELSPQTGVLVLTNYADDEQVFGAMKAGAIGYLLKDVQPADLIQAIRRVYYGEVSLSPLIAKKLVGEFTRPKSSEPALEAELTPKEREVLGLLAQGKSNKEIAHSLFITEKMVKTHVSNILDKLYLQNRTEAALYAMQHGLVQHFPSPE